MEIKDIYKKLRDFVIAATSYDGGKVIFANQLSNARPKKPFITIGVKNFRNIVALPQYYKQFFFCSSFILKL